MKDAVVRLLPLNGCSFLKGEAMKQQRLHLLICDSDPEILIYLERMLEDAGYDTTTTWNSLDLTRLLKQSAFDLLVIGDHPPRVDVKVILTELHAELQYLPDVLCLVCDQSLDHTRVELLRAAGATDVVCRGNYDSVLDRVEFHLQTVDSAVHKAS